MDKKYFIFFLLFFLLLGNAVAPFVLNDYHGNIVPVDSVDLEIANEEIIFNIIDNKIEGDVKYEILNNENKINFGFIFPLFSNYKDDFEIYFNDNKVKFEIVDQLSLKEILSDKWENFEKVVSNENIIFIDPIKKILYHPQNSYSCEKEFLTKFYIFILNFEENSKNILHIKFKAISSEDRKSYPKTLYSYFYILNTKKYFKDFKNINIKIYYPKEYLFSVNFNGDTKIINDKILFETNLKEINENLTFSYMKSRISNISILIYKKFPIFYSPYFILISLFFFFIIIFVGFIIFIIIKLIKRKRRNV